MDIQETADGYQLQAELPGLTKEDINITLENNVLRLAGERKFEKDAKKDSYHRIERTYGTFTRAFALPSRSTPRASGGLRERHPDDHRPQGGAGQAPQDRDQLSLASPRQSRRPRSGGAFSFQPLTPLGLR